MYSLHVTGIYRFFFFFCFCFFVEEAKKSVFGHNSSWKDGKIIDKITIDEETEVRLIRKGVAR